MAEVRSFSLSELLGSVRRCLEHSFPDRYWVRAEVSDLRRAGGIGHGYLELLEKGEQGEVTARVRATIWSSTYQAIEQSFVRSGVGALTSGMSILCLVSVAFHPQYGLSLNIIDIDPNYSLGEIARLRQETINRLKRAGLWSLNKEHELPRPLQRLAIISSSTAAGYEDFMRQLQHNAYGVICYTALFRAQMQGEQTTSSILAALERILRHEEAFDAVVIIRGGGAVSELRAFDDYALCEGVAQYPLPVITGIGHERDLSVLDMIAHTSLKTPTAVATYLIEGLASELALVEEHLRTLPHLLQSLSLGRSHWLHQLASRLPLVARARLEQAQRNQRAYQSQLTLSVHTYFEQARHRTTLSLQRLPLLCQHLLQRRRLELSHLLLPLRLATSRQQERQQSNLEHQEQAIRLAHPDNILQRGFSIVSTKQGIITRRSHLTAETPISIRFADGIVEAVTKPE
mgnify:FL=1